MQYVLQVVLLIFLLKFSKLDNFGNYFQHGREIFINNTIGFQSQNDVLIQFNTLNLTNEQKIDANCVGLQFYDDSENSYLEFWIENCGSNKTNIWVRVYNITVLGKSIFMYYYYQPSISQDYINDNNFVTNPKIWNGELFIPSSTQGCRYPMLPASIINENRFIIGNSAFGIENRDDHVHSIVNITSGGEVDHNEYWLEGGSPSEAIINNQYSHTHDLSFSEIFSESLPDYYNAYFCKTTNLEFPFDNGDLVFFTGSDNSLPVNFDFYDKLENRFIRGSTTDIDQTGGQSTHSHTAGVTAGVVTHNVKGQGSIRYMKGGGLSACGYNHEHNLQYINLLDVQHLPLYIEVVSSKCTGVSSISNSMILIFSELPPFGYDWLNNLNDHFVFGSRNYGNEGGSFHHTHEVEFYTERSPMLDSFDHDINNAQIINAWHRHLGTTNQCGSVSNKPNSVSIIFGSKKQSFDVIIFEEENYESDTVDDDTTSDDTADDTTTDDTADDIADDTGLGSEDITLVVVLSAIGGLVLVVCLLFIGIAIFVSILIVKKKKRFKKLQNDIYRGVGVTETSINNDQSSPNNLELLKLNKDLSNISINSTFNIRFKDVKLIREIAKGASSHVFQAKWKSKIVAMKVFHTSNFSEKYSDEFGKG